MQSAKDLLIECRMHAGERNETWEKDSRKAAFARTKGQTRQESRPSHQVAWFKSGPQLLASISYVPTSVPTPKPIENKPQQRRWCGKSLKYKILDIEPWSSSSPYIGQQADRVAIIGKKNKII